MPLLNVNQLGSQMSPMGDMSSQLGGLLNGPPAPQFNDQLSPEDQQAAIQRMMQNRNNVAPAAIAPGPGTPFGSSDANAVMPEDAMIYRTLLQRMQQEKI